MQDTFATRQGMPRPLLLALLGFGAVAAHATFATGDEDHAAASRKHTRLVLRNEAASARSLRT